MRVSPLAPLLAALASACLSPPPATAALVAPGSGAPGADLPLRRKAVEAAADVPPDGLARGLVLEAFALPVASIGADDDPLPGGALGFEPDLHTGTGYGVGAGFWKQNVGLGLLYLTSVHLVRDTDVAARFHGAFLEARTQGRYDWGGLRTTLTLGFGVGLAGVDLEALFRDSAGTAIETRASLGFLIGRHMAFEIGAGAFSWGLPGETIGLGTFASAGLTLRL